ncbi:hypothetical protein EMIHUDRAFT_209293 [Emiliania huxleyi CCMP1516]|uniref:Uncharacterized protein n=2 Tax=Emiliania huxleyi TaxID=2903 RepID=A0A0D3J5G5_EMIH1|nr:hypothetical protein EMIHUDRAFT_209293 [Emiliania huxleyi CCMP1516]EOD18750.1 hypothetical protein EMIHUDRAFT_209293 [Emiliania huxleyi CCMP1516]|eukprot:XP_005771179.1 hypothetical protein EMIHUDRAFT_209293 [Emiliania huxleyi CCMP1516]
MDWFREQKTAVQMYDIKHGADAAKNANGDAYKANRLQHIDWDTVGGGAIFAGVPSDPSGVGRMGAFVACGNTLPRARETVLGVEGGDRGGRVGRWDPRTGSGTVEAVKGQYTDAEGNVVRGSSVVKFFSVYLC